jgi:hypothetical protein
MQNYNRIAGMADFGKVAVFLSGKRAALSLCHSEKVSQSEKNAFL